MIDMYPCVCGVPFFWSIVEGTFKPQRVAKEARARCGGKAERGWGSEPRVGVE